MFTFVDEDQFFSIIPQNRNKNLAMITPGLSFLSRIAVGLNMRFGGRWLYLKPVFVERERMPAKQGLCSKDREPSKRNLAILAFTVVTIMLVGMTVSFRSSISHEVWLYPPSDTPIQRQELYGGANAAHWQFKSNSLTSTKAVVMSCPQGTSASHHGDWKPNQMNTGIGAVAQQMAAHQSNLTLIVAYFPHEKETLDPWCSNLQAEYKKSVKIDCFLVPEEYPSGYGISKITVIHRVFVAEVMWLDCDVFPTRALDDLFNDAEYGRTGAMFWPDFGDHFDEQKVSVSAVLDPLPNFDRKSITDSWDIRIGFDSGILVLNKAQRQTELNQLVKMTQNYENSPWKELSLGDKDLWKLAWLAVGTNYTLVPRTGALGTFDQSGNFILTSQLKHDRHGNVVALHQLHRSRRRSATPNFGNLFWSKLGEQMAYSIPSETIEVDIRELRCYQGIQAWTWANMSQQLEPHEIFHTANEMRMKVSAMAEAWSYERIPQQTQAFDQSDPPVLHQRRPYLISKTWLRNRQGLTEAQLHDKKASKRTATWDHSIIRQPNQVHDFRRSRNVASK